MSGVRVGGTWRTPAITSVKVAGTWRTVSTMSVKVAGTWRTSSFAGPPPVPTLAYTAQGTFTITNYDPTLTYTVTGATRSGSQLTGISSGATIKTAYSPGAPQSAARTMYVANHGIVLTTVAATPSSTGCGPRPDLCCPAGTTQSAVSPVQCGGSPGTRGDYCGGSCPGDCFGLFVTCRNYYWTDYSSSGYTLIGSIWGKAA